MLQFPDWNSVLLLLCFSFLNGNAQPVVQNLKSTIHDYRDAPRKTEAIFSWQIIGVKRNQFQSAYRIVASDNAENLKADRGFFWECAR